MKASFNAHVTRPLGAGYPRFAVATVTERLKKPIVSRANMDPKINSNKCAVGILYTHCLSHRLKKVGSAYSVNAAFTAANKLGKICTTLQRKNKQIIDKKCTNICF